MLFNIHPINLIKALSQALELSNGGLGRHHWRTAMIANRIAEYLGVEKQQRNLLVYAGLLHDLGAVSNWEEKHRIRNIELAQTNIYEHAEAGYLLLKDSKQLGPLAAIIRHHHDHWDGSSPYSLAGEAIPLFSRIINLADKVEAHLTEDNILEHYPAILAIIRKQSGSVFDPELVKALHDFGRRESFWLDLTNPHYYQNFFQSIDDYGRLPFQINDIIDVAEIFATIIDRTSRFTGAHSRSVATVAAYLAQARGYSQAEVKLMRVAGLFHDIGKLAIPNSILEKTGKLTDREFAIIKQHPYYTYRILEQIDGFQTIAEWAALHHETLDGSGYPFRVGEDSLHLGSRMVAVADVFTALSENRPYRQGLDLKEIENIMRGMVSNRKLDAAVVSDLFINSSELYVIMQQRAASYEAVQESVCKI